MRQEAKVAVVIPARDEARHIAGVVRGVPAWVDAIVLVDDGSTDGTSARAREVGDPRLQIIRREAPGGVGDAIKAGYLATLERGDADVAVVMAGDGQMDPADLPALLQPILDGRAGYAKGDRLTHPERRAMPSVRRRGTRLFGVLTGLFAGRPIRDAQCGYTALSRDAAARIDLHALWRSYGYPGDLLVRLARAGVSIAEVPVRPVYRDEVSGLRWYHATLIPFVLLRATRA